MSLFGKNSEFGPQICADDADRMGTGGTYRLFRARFLLRALLACFKIAPPEDVLGDELPEPESSSP